MPTTTPELNIDLRAEPWQYPGPLPDGSGVLLGDRFRPLRQVEHRRLGQARVAISPGEDGERCTELPLNYVLLRENAAAVDARTLVVAIGSNASPGVMRRKFADLSNAAMPLMRGELVDIDVAHSAHVSTAGYIAAAPFRRPGTRRRVWAALLDETQVRRLDETEPNYIRRTFSSGLVLENGERPAAFYIYTSVWGVLGAPSGAIAELGSQDDLLSDMIARLPELADLLAERTGLGVHALTDAKVLLPALARDEALRDAVRDLMAVEGWAHESGLDTLPYGESVIPYGRTGPRWAGDGAPASGALEVRGTPDDLDRSGEPCVVLNPDEARKRSIDTHAVVGPASDLARPGVVARVVSDTAQPPGSVGLDQVVRNALGVELREHVLLGRAAREKSQLADALIARPHFVVCRVQPADLATVEQPVCLLDALAMSILGVDGGDEVVIEGTPDEHGDVRSIRLKAHDLPDSVRERRQSVAGGSLDARFPSARDALAVHPDLPWVFLDSAARTSLGLDGKLAAVRVRASRRHQWSEEIRELLLILVIAFIGLATLIDSVLVLLGVLAGVSLVAVALIRARVRLRLRSRMRRIGAAGD